MLPNRLSCKTEFVAVNGINSQLVQPQLSLQTFLMCMSHCLKHPFIRTAAYSTQGQSCSVCSYWTVWSLVFIPRQRRHLSVLLVCFLSQTPVSLNCCRRTVGQLVNTIFAFSAGLWMNSAIKGNSGNISFRIRVIYGRLSGNNLQRTTCTFKWEWFRISPKTNID